MNRSKRIFFTWDDGYKAFNTFQDGTSYLRQKYGISFKDAPEGWFGVDDEGITHWLWSTIIYYNDGNTNYDSP